MDATLRTIPIGVDLMIILASLSLRILTGAVRLVDKLVNVLDRDDGIPEFLGEEDWYFPFTGRPPKDGDAR